MKRVIIRTLGGKNIGYGHYFRCLSLAKAIRLIDKSVDIVFLINEELVEVINKTGFNYVVNNDLSQDIEIIENKHTNLFIFDSYLASNEYLRRVKEKSKLMLIDDNNDIYDSSIPNIIYNGNIHADNLGYEYIEGQIRLLGPKYLIMKEEYWQNEYDMTFKNGILITTGGTDNFGITLNIINEIKDLGISIKVIVGPGYKDDFIKEIENTRTKNISLIYRPSSLKEYIRTSKIIITACGSTIYEVLSQKSMPIIFSIADNQDLLCKELINNGVEYFGKYPNIDYLKLKYAIKRGIDTGINEKNRLFDLIDGKGALIVANILVSQMKS